MSTTAFTEVDDPDLETTGSVPFVHTPRSLDYAITHVFLPVNLPNDNDYSLENELSLSRAVCAAAHVYISYTAEPQWYRISRMLDNLQASIESEHLDDGHIISQLRGMQTGGTVTLSL